MYKVRGVYTFQLPDFLGSDAVLMCGFWVCDFSLCHSEDVCGLCLSISHNLMAFLLYFLLNALGLGPIGRC